MNLSATSKFYNACAFLIFGSLLSLALGLVTSISVLALFHILIIIPIIFFLNKTHYKLVSKSMWCLLALTIAIVLSVVFNQDIATHGYQSISKAKYFLLGFLAVAPLSWYFKNHMTEKKLSWLLYLFCVATTFGTIVGLYSQYSGFNPITSRVADHVRNTGFFGMVMNYAHNLAYFEIIILGIIIFRKNFERLINLNFVYFVFVVNLVGLYMSFTRGAALGLLFGAPFYFFKGNKKVFMSVVVVVLLAGVGSYVASGRMVSRDRSNQERISQWEASMKAFQERPILGYGYLNFETHSVEIKKRYGIGSQDFGGHAHNNFFEILSTTGLIGFIAFVAWLGFWLYEVFQQERIFCDMNLAFIVTFVVGGLTQSTIALGINLFFIMGFYSISQGVLLRNKLVN
jgi:O-antigen ligase